MELNIVLPIVAFLSTISIVGIVLYLYLRQEQNKIIPKDRYDEARTEFDTRSNHRLYNPTISSIIVSRLLIFYSTFVVVVVLSLLVIGISNGSNALENIKLVLLSVIGSPLILLIFPVGITALFTPNAVFSRNFEGLLIGYILYLVVCSLGIFVKDRRAFTIIYLIFITLLIMNVVGCSRIKLVS